MGDAADSSLPDPTEILEKLLLKRGHAPPRRMKRAPVASDRGAMDLLRYMDEVLRRCGMCGALEAAPHLPNAGSSSASSFNGNLQADLLCPDDAIALHSKDVYSR